MYNTEGLYCLYSKSRLDRPLFLLLLLSTKMCIVLQHDVYTLKFTCTKTKVYKKPSISLFIIQKVYFAYTVKVLLTGHI